MSDGQARVEQVDELTGVVVNEKQEKADNIERMKPAMRRHGKDRVD
jgi:hypothetical protein